ncbi:MAG TPA: ABC transporter ATP-binding protein [Anaerolineales bacterium]|nr:ABC transporter ATP-binding protein [Anaerolineales bacterium]HLO32377.1 ABC transporter ATP-binding protein [Anaerolineales bacterium]
MFLEIDQLTMQFGGLVAVNNVSISIDKGEIHGLIGPNGSGKTTIFNVLSGYYKPTGGKVSFDGRVISGLPAHQITAAGFARTFQNMRLFKTMTVLENLLVAMGHHAKVNLFQEIFNPVAVRREEGKFVEKAMELLDLLEVGNFANELATSLPYGHQRRVEMARALATDPKVILLDEPAAGLNEVETEDLRKTLIKIRDMGVTIFLVEHDMKLVMGICEKISVLDYGKKIAEGTGPAIRENPVVIEAYLGKEDD